MILSDGDYTCRVVDDLPADGMCMESPDGHINIYLKGSLCSEQMRRVAIHELEHGLKGHFHRDISAEDAEIEADEIDTELLNLIQF